MSEYRVIVGRLYESLNARRFEDLGAVLDDDVVLEMNGRSLRGLASVSEALAAAVRELPGLSAELTRVMAESGDTIVTEARHFDALPAAGSEPAVWGGWRLPVTICAEHRITAGRIVEWRCYLGAELADELSGPEMAPWPGVARLVAEQAALQRVATLVARGGAQPDLFEAIVSEAAQLLGKEAWLLRFGDDDTGTVVARCRPSGAGELPGHAYRMVDDGVPGRIRRTGRPARADRNSPGLTGPAADAARRLGVTASAGTPLAVEGGVWGALMVVSRGRPLVPGIEDRLARFADLAATAIANAQSRADLQLLADEQGALLRVAELVARGAATEEVFNRVTVEAERLFDDAPTALFRYERSGSEVVVVAQSRPDTMGRGRSYFQVGRRVPVIGEVGRAQVWRTGRAARIDDYAGISGTEMIPPGVRASVSAPIIVEGRLWGVLSATSPGPPLPAGTEERLTRFCELIAAAIANAESRTELTASRARIVASGDEARRRLARDVHDGAQQRQVHAIIMLKQAQAALATSGDPAAGLVEESLRQAESANQHLRELVHGIMPAALARGGLRAGVDSLRAHVPLAVEAEVPPGRLPERVETTAYFVIAEALTNVVKHAEADHARVRAVVGGARLEVEVSDNGCGGADPAGGSGLVGIADRVAAAGGTLSLVSAPGRGTTLSIVLPGVGLSSPSGPG